MTYQKNLNALKLDAEKSLLKTHVEIQEQTFQNISREIHDNIGLSLTLTKLNLNMLDWQNLEKMHISVKTTIEILGSAIGDLSNLSKSMNTELIRNLGLMKAIKNEIEKLQSVAPINVSYQIFGEPVFIDCEEELVIFRIIQEAFNNIIKHASASIICLELNYNHKSLEVLIKDNGIGFIKDGVKAYHEELKSGLVNMQKRAALLGGRLLIKSQPYKGTQILVHVPYK